MYFVYTLLSLKDRDFYIGFTNDLDRRLKEHKRGESFATKHRLPITLIYYEVCSDFEDAKAREKYLKSGMGRKYLKNRIAHHLEKINKTPPNT